MAYDGIIIRAQINEINKLILNERINKIIQKHNKNLSLVFKKNNKYITLSININPEHPYMCIENEKPNNTNEPYAFTMLLRKYIEGGRVESIKQIDGKNDNNSLERIIEINIKNTINNGDINNYKLIIEFLGRYSNVLLVDKNLIIIDVMYKIKNINNKLRILKPKNKYSTIELYQKQSLINITYIDFIKALNNSYLIKKNNNENINLVSIFLQSFYGISKSYILNIFNNLNINENIILNDIVNNKDNPLLKQIYHTIQNEINIINKKTSGYIFYENNKIKDFHIFDLSIYNDKEKYNTINDMIISYHKNKYNTNIENNKINYLKQIIDKLIEKTNKKIELNEIEIEKSKDFEKDKLYGEMINTFGFDNNNIKDNILICKNYYDNDKKLFITIDNSIAIMQNAKKYYDMYNKKKRTITMATEQINKLKNELIHLINIKETLQFANEKNDILLIEKELYDTFKKTKKDKIKNNTNKNNNKINIKHYKASDGTDIYLGKNNIQNEYLTFNLAKPNDTWLHVKNATGSHVIIKKDYNELDIKILEQAASLCAYYSSLNNEKKVTVDYTLKKELKKVKNMPKGFVIYHKNFSINVTPKITLKEIL